MPRRIKSSTAPSRCIDPRPLNRPETRPQPAGYPWPENAPNTPVKQGLVLGRRHWTRRALEITLVAWDMIGHKPGPGQLILMRGQPTALLIHLPVYAALLTGWGCAAPGPRLVEPEPIEPIVNLVDEDLRNTGGFSEEVLYELLVAELAGSRGQLDDSLQRYLEMAQSTRDSRVIERAARIALYAEDDDAARQAVALWLEVDPQSPSAHQIMGSLALKSGDEATALHHFRTIISDPGPLPPKLWLIIGALNRVENSDDAIRIMDEVMHRFKANEEVMLNYASMLMRLNKFAQAAQIYETLATGDPPNTEALRARLAIFGITGAAGDAERWLKEILEKTEGDARNTVRLHYAQVLAQADKLLEAIEQLKILIDVQPDRGDALLSAGLIYLELGRNAEAMRTFNLLVEQETFTHEASYFLGWLAEQQDDTDKAWQWYSSVPSGPTLSPGADTPGRVAGRPRRVRAGAAQVVADLQRQP